MKVLMVVLSDMAFDVRVYKEAKSVTERGHSVRVISYRSGSRTRLLATGGFEVLEVGFSPVKKGTFLSLWTALSFALRFIFTVITARADVYHAHNVNTLPFCWIAARLHRARLVYDAHELWQAMTEPKGWKRKLKYTVEKRLERWLAPKANRVITANDYYADQMCTSLRITRPTVINNYPELVTKQPSAWLRRRVSLSADQRIVLYQGGFWLDTRALENLILAVEHLPLNTVLVLVGFGRSSDTAKLRALAESIGTLNTRVFILDAVPHQDLPQVTMSADVGVIPFFDLSPAMHFCTPNKVYEYLMAGIPVVSTDMPALRTAIVDHQVGAVFRSTDPADMARAILQVLDSDLLALKTLARSTAEELYHWGRESEKLQVLYGAL